MYRFIKTLTFIIFIAASLQATSQIDTYVGISAGPSFPIGDLKSTEYNFGPSGHAKLGSAFRITTVSRFIDQIGLVFMYSRQAYALDEESYAAHEEEFEEEWTVESEGWTLNCFMIGYSGGKKLISKLTFSYRLMFGFVRGISPSILANSTDNFGNKTVYSMESEKGNGFAYDLGIGLNYDISPNWIITSSFDVLWNSIDFETTYVNETDNFSTPFSFSQAISSMTLDVGIAYRFGSY